MTNNIEDAQTTEPRDPEWSSETKSKPSTERSLGKLCRWGSRLGKRLRRDSPTDDDKKSPPGTPKTEASIEENRAWNLNLTGMSPEERIVSLQNLSSSLKERRGEFQERSSLVRHELILERRAYDIRADMLRSEIEEKIARLARMEREWGKKERDLENMAEAADREMISQYVIREEVEREITHAITDRESRTRKEREQGEERSLDGQKNEMDKQTEQREMKVEVEECVGSGEGDNNIDATSDILNMSDITLISVDISKDNSPMDSEDGDAHVRRKD